MVDSINQQRLDAFLERRRFVALLGSGYNGVAIRYAVDAAPSANGPPRDEEWVAKIELRTSTAVWRKIARENAVISSAGAVLGAPYFQTNGVCPVLLTFVLDERQFLATFGDDMARTNSLGIEALAKFKALVQRWGFELEQPPLQERETTMQSRREGLDGAYYSYIGNRLVRRFTQSVVEDDVKPAQFNVQLQRFCGQESLQDFLDAKLDSAEASGDFTLRNDELRCYFFELAWALTQLHNEGIVHNDLVASNIVMERQRRNTVQRFTVGANAELEWSFVSPGGVEGFEQRGRPWQTDRQRRLVQELGEYAIPVVGSQGSVEQSQTLLVLPDDMSDDNDDDTPQERVALIDLDGKELRDRPLARFYRVCWNSRRPRIIDFGQSVLIRQPNTPLLIETIDTEFALLNDVQAYGATRSPYPEFYFTRSLQRSYETDMWDLAMIVIEMALNGRRMDDVLARLDRSLPSSVSREFMRRFEGVYPSSEASRSYSAPLEMLRIYNFTDVTSSVLGRPRRVATVTDEFQTVLVDLYEKAFNRKWLTLAEMQQRRERARKTNSRREEELLRRRVAHMERSRWTIEAMLLTCLFQKAMGNGVLPSATIDDQSGEIRNAEPSEWPEVRYTRMFQALQKSRAARRYLFRTPTTLFDAFVTENLRSAMGDSGFELLRRMLSWSPRTRLRGGYINRAQVARTLTRIERQFSVALQPVFEQVAQQVATEREWPFAPQLNVLPLGANYILLDPYFLALTTPRTTRFVPPRTDDNASNTVRNVRLTNTDIPPRLPKETTTVDFETWSMPGFDLPSLVFESEQQQHRVFSSIIDTLQMQTAPYSLSTVQQSPTQTLARQQVPSDNGDGNEEDMESVLPVFTQDVQVQQQAEALRQVFVANEYVRTPVARVIRRQQPAKRVRKGVPLARKAPRIGSSQEFKVVRSKV